MNLILKYSNRISVAHFIFIISIQVTATSLEEIALISSECHKIFVDISHFNQIDIIMILVDDVITWHNHVTSYHAISYQMLHDILELNKK